MEKEKEKRVRAGKKSKEEDLDYSYCTLYPTTERLFHSKSYFWLCYCKPAANNESVWHISALQALCSG